MATKGRRYDVGGTPTLQKIKKVLTYSPKPRINWKNYEASLKMCTFGDLLFCIIKNKIIVEIRCLLDIKAIECSYKLKVSKSTNF